MKFLLIAIACCLSASAANAEALDVLSSKNYGTKREQLNEIKKTHPHIVVNYIIALSYCYYQQGHLTKEESLAFATELEIELGITNQQFLNLANKEISGKLVEDFGCYKLTEATRMPWLEEQTAKN